MFYLNMVDYPVYFPSLSTLTWDTFLTLRGTLGFFLKHVLPPSCDNSEAKICFPFFGFGLDLASGLSISV